MVPMLLAGGGAGQGTVPALGLWCWHGRYAPLSDRDSRDPGPYTWLALAGMFGAGLYFADCASKACQYVHSGKCKQAGMAPRDAARPLGHLPLGTM